jgi:di/tricarboxylate transporter
MYFFRSPLALQHCSKFNTHLIQLRYRLNYIAMLVSASGLSQRLMLRLARRARTFAGLCYRLTAVLTLTTFAIPATSGRAALMLPIFLSISAALA